MKRVKCATDLGLDRDLLALNGSQRPDAGGGWYLRTRAVWKCSKDYDYLLQSDADAAKEKMKGLPET